MPTDTTNATQARSDARLLFQAVCTEIDRLTELFLRPPRTLAEADRVDADLARLATLRDALAETVNDEVDAEHPPAPGDPRQHHTHRARVTLVPVLAVGDTVTHAATMAYGIPTYEVAAVDGDRVKLVRDGLRTGWLDASTYRKVTTP